MPRKNEYTFIVERPMGHALAERLAAQLAKSALKREGFTAEITVRELRPDEEPHLIQNKSEGAKES